MTLWSQIQPLRPVRLNLVRISEKAALPPRSLIIIAAETLNPSCSSGAAQVRQWLYWAATGCEYV